MLKKLMDYLCSPSSFGPENDPSVMDTINLPPKGVDPMTMGSAKVRFALNSNVKVGGTG